MSMKRRDWLRRFILLIDTLYYMHINVVIEAEVPLEELFEMEEGGDGAFNAATRTKGGVDIHMLEDLQGMEDRTGNDKKKEDALPAHFDEEFAYSRCVSRLHEMQTEEYQNECVSKSKKEN